MMPSHLVDKARKEGCCEVGTYVHQVPMAIRGRRSDICIADLVAALNAANIVTVASCCGHGEQDGSILLEDGRELIICGGREDE